MTEISENVTCKIFTWKIYIKNMHNKKLYTYLYGIIDKMEKI